MAIRFIRTPTGIIRYDNNFTDEQKRKLLNIEWGAQVNTVLGVKGSNESKWRIGYIEINKDNVGLGRADNTPDVEKNVFSATRLTTGRDITIGNKTVNFNGTVNIGYTLREIGAVNRAGDTMTGKLTGTVIEAPSLIGELTGNSSSATKLKTGRDITIGDKTVNFDGTKNIGYTIREIGATRRDGDTIIGTYTFDMTTMDKSINIASIPVNKYGIHLGSILGTGLYLVANSSGKGIIINTNGESIGLDINVSSDNSCGIKISNETDAYSIYSVGKNYLGVLTAKSLSVTDGIHATDLAVPINFTIGNKTISFNGASAMNYTLKDIGAVNRAGDTMTGKLTGTVIEAPSLIGELTGNASSATKLKTGRDITIGNRTVNFDGTSNISYTLAQIGAVNRAGDTMTGALTGTTITANSFVGPLTGNAATATKLAAGRDITIGNRTVNFDGSANISYTLAQIGAVNRAGDTMTGKLTGTVIEAPSLIGELTGNASTATKFKKAMKLTIGNKTYDLDGSTDLVYTFNDVGYLTSDTKYAASDTVGGAAKNLNYFLTTATTSLGLEQSVNAIGYVSNVNILGQNDGALIVQRYSDSWKAEIFIDYRTGQMATRGKNNGTWQSWRTQLDSGNYGSYAVPLAGGTMTGALTGTTITANSFVGPLTGNASTATKLQTARTIALSGSVTGSANFDGSGNITISTSTNHNHDSLYLKLTGGTMSGNLNIVNTSPVLTIKNSGGNDASLVFDRNANANWKILDSNGNLYFQTDFTSSKQSSYHNVMTLEYNTGYVRASRFVGAVTGDVTGNASTASKLATARTIALSGSVTGSASFDGSGNITISTSTNHNHDSLYLKLTGNASSATKLKTGRDITIGNRTVNFDGSANISYTLAQIGAVNKAGDTMTGALTGTTITANSFVGPLTGNASTATKLQTARTITVTGAVTGSVSFDGSANVTLSTSVNHSHSYLPLAGGTMTGDIGIPIAKSKIDGSVPYCGSYDTALSITSFASYKTYLGAYYDSSNAWWNMISIRHRNGNGDGNSYGMYIRSSLTSSGSLLWGKQYSSSSWQSERTILDSANYTSYTVTKTGSGASGTWGINISGNASTASKLATARTIALTGSVTGSANFDGSGNITISTTTNHTHSYLPLSGGTMTGNIEFSNSGTTSRGVIGTVGDNDYWRIIGGATTSNAGFLEISTADDGSEPIYVRQYSSGKFVTLKRTLTLLDGNGNSSFPGTVTAPTFSGSLSGNATSASYVKVSNNGGTSTLSFTSSTPSGTGLTVTLPYYYDSSTMAKVSSANINAGTATKLKTARTIALSGSVTGSASFDGSGNITISTSTNHTHSYLPLSGGAMTGLITAKTEASHTGIKLSNTYLTAIGDNVIFQNNYAIRFGGDRWDWNVWAGLRYDSSNKIIYLGLADGTIFQANAGQSGGALKFPGISNVYVDTIKLNSNNNLGITYGTKTDIGTGMIIGDITASGNASYTVIGNDCKAAKSLDIHGTTTMQSSVYAYGTLQVGTNSSNRSTYLYGTVNTYGTTTIGTSSSNKDLYVHGYVYIDKITRTKEIQTEFIGMKYNSNYTGIYASIKALQKKSGDLDTTYINLYASKGINVEGDAVITGTTTIESYLGVHAEVWSNAHYPSTNATYNLGTGSYKWANVYSSNGTIQTSDERFKNIRGSVNDKYKALITKISPIIYTFKNEENTHNHDRVHVGFSAQEVKRIMDEVGLEDIDFAGYCKDNVYPIKEIEEGNITREVEDTSKNPVDYRLSLRYGEFIPIITAVLQDVIKENKELKERLDRIEAKQ